MIKNRSHLNGNFTPLMCIRLFLLICFYLEALRRCRVSLLIYCQLKTHRKALEFILNNYFVLDCISKNKFITNVP